MQKSRRRFIRGGVYICASPTISSPLIAWAQVHSDSRQQTLDDTEWHTLKAVTGRIIPTDSTPGANEARCVNFIDNMLADGHGHPMTISLGLAEIHRLCLTLHQKSFFRLEALLQDNLIADLQKGAIKHWQQPDIAPDKFFDMIWALTITAFLADPKYGGNFGHVGWKLAGFPGHNHQLGHISPEQMQGRRSIPTAWGGAI